MSDSDLVTKEHPIVEAFVDLVDATAGDGILDFTDIQTPSFIKFWEYLIILRHEEDVNDFRFVLHGSSAVALYGMDCTGKLMSEVGLGEAYQEKYQADMRVLNEKTRIYASGTLFWRNKDYKEWYRVKMPLRRKGRVNEVLVCVCAP